MSNQPLKISRDEMYTAGVQDYIDTQASLARNVEAPEPQSWLRRLLYSNWFYLMIWGGIGALVAWALIEPHIDDSRISDDTDIGGLLLFPGTAAFVGLFLGAAEGIMCRNMSRALTSGVVGLAVGLMGGCAILIPANIVFITSIAVAVSFSPNMRNGEMPTGIGLFIVMLGRTAAWAMVAIPAGVGQGIALRERKVIFNGLLGAVLGGAIGGFLFDPISVVLTSPDGQATYSRAVGLTVIGLIVGLFIGLIEGWTKTAWLQMRKGPLAGKQFILFKDVTILGSSPKAEIYLFKDQAIEPKHAIIYNRGGRFEIEDCNTPDGTYINGVPLAGKRFLQPGDQVVLGKTVLEFALKESGN